MTARSQKFGVGPLRSSALVLRCADCDEVATIECARCARPRCAEHAGTDDAELCSHCQSEWERFYDEPEALTAPTFSGTYVAVLALGFFGFAALASISSGVTQGFEALFTVATLAIPVAAFCSAVIAIDAARERQLMHKEHRLLVERRRDHKDTERKRFLAGAKAPPQLEAPEEQSKPSIPSFHAMLRNTGSQGD